MKKNRIVGVIFIALLAISVMFAGVVDAATTQRDHVVSLIKSAGMKDAMISVGSNDQFDRDADALARNLGFLDNWNYNPTAVITDQVKASMDVAMADAYNGLRGALNKKPMEPYFVHGMAQPIFYYGNSHFYDTSGEGAVRFAVYVETDLDTDNDGKLDLVKVIVQLPRAALNGAKFSTVYDARPYIAGRNSGIGGYMQRVGDAYLAAHPNLSHSDHYKTASPRVPSGIVTTAEMVTNARYSDWYYKWTGSSGNDTSQSLGIIAPAVATEAAMFENLNWYDYFLVRGFAVVVSAGIGSAGSEGFSTCGSDIEVNAYRCIVEWLAGDRAAYTNRENNIEIKADWSNGNVGMTGRSYAGTTQFGMSTSGVKGLKTIVPVAGIASWYEYSYSQGSAIRSPYDVGLAWTVGSRSANPEWSSIFEKYAGYSQLMRYEERDLHADYGPFWARRDYTVENWFRDWGPSKIKTPMLIVHSANDDNVRPKHSVMMYESAKKAGVDVKWLWHQGEHMTPTFPKENPNIAGDSPRPFSMYCGDYTYDEWLNMWFSHHLYGLDNGIMKKLPNVLAHDNASGKWASYDSWDSSNKITLNDTQRVKPSPMMALSAARYEEPDYRRERTNDDFPVFDDLDAIHDEGVIMPTSSPAVKSVFSAAADNVTVINSANGSSSFQNFLDAPTAGSTVYHFDLKDNVTIKGVTKVNIRAAISSVANPMADGVSLNMHAKLVEVAAPGTTLKYYGRNTMGGTPARILAQSGGSWQGGGIASHNLAEFEQVTSPVGGYREIAKGWMDLCNPKAGFYSYTADRKDRIVASGDTLGVYHNYTIYLLPVVHTATKGNKLALIITTGTGSTAGYTGNNAFTFTIDNDATYAEIPIANPIEVPVITIDTNVVPTTVVTEGCITGSLKIAASGTMGVTLNYQWYSNTTNSDTGGTLISGATNVSFPIPKDLAIGTYYYYCVVSATGAESVISSVAKVVVEEGTGCNAVGYGYLAFVLFGIVPFIIRVMPLVLGKKG
jgi:X-Pro dipeptidyl-peptidase